MFTFGHRQIAGTSAIGWHESKTHVWIQIQRFTVLVVLRILGGTMYRDLPVTC